MVLSLLKLELELSLLILLCQCNCLIADPFGSSSYLSLLPVPRLHISTFPVSFLDGNKTR